MHENGALIESEADRIKMTIDKLLMLILAPRYWRPLFVNHTAGGVEHEPVVSFVRPDTVIDVGANKGQFSLAVRAAAPRARVIAFEALKDAAAIFRRNFDGDLQVRLEEVALANADGTTTFYVADRRDSSSLLKPGTLQQKIFDVGQESTLTVVAKRLDSVLSLSDLTGISLLKIDVQGAELLVLEGATKLLPKITHVYTEVSFMSLYDGQALFRDVYDYLTARSFELAGIANAQFDRQFGAVQADALFVRSA